MNVAFKTQASNPQKPTGMPDAWPWGQVVQLGESTQAPTVDTDWIVMSQSAFEGYKAIHRPAFNTYQAVIAAEAAAIAEVTRKNLDKEKFCKDLLMRFKKKNIDEGISVDQGIWLQHRVKKIVCQKPGMPETELDLVNLTFSGDVEIGCVALQYAVPDDMTQPYHWLSQARINWLVSEMKAWLGWP